jgi:hypothetical protein
MFDDQIFNTSEWLARGWCVRHVIEEHLTWKTLTVYTYPTDLQDHRILINHRFVARTNYFKQKSNIQCMTWQCTKDSVTGIDIHSPCAVKHSLRVLSRVYHLNWQWNVFPSVQFSTSVSS